MGLLKRQHEEPQELMNIGEVIKKLQSEFSDLTPSKLRFFEERGLITPLRTSSGYRKFSSDSIDRLRFILTLQRDKFMPLKVISGYLDQLDSGRSLSSLEIELGVANSSGFHRNVSLSQHELLERSGASSELFEQAVLHGFITRNDLYGQDALAMLDILSKLNSAGLDPRHLKFVRLAAMKELDLVFSSFRASGNEKKLKSADDLSEILDKISDLRTMVHKINLSNNND